MVLLSGHLSSDTAVSVALALTPPCPSACVSSASAEDGEALHSCWAAALTASSGGGCCAAGAATAGREGGQESLRGARRHGATAEQVQCSAQQTGIDLLHSEMSLNLRWGPEAVSLTQWPGVAAAQVEQNAVPFS